MFYTTEQRAWESVRATPPCKSGHLFSKGKKSLPEVQSIRAEIKKHLKKQGKPSSGFAIPALPLDPHGPAGTEGDWENVPLFTHHFKPSEPPFPGGLGSATTLNSKYFPSWQMKKPPCVCAWLYSQRTRNDKGPGTHLARANYRIWKPT